MPPLRFIRNRFHVPSLTGPILAALALAGLLRCSSTPEVPQNTSAFNEFSAFNSTKEDAAIASPTTVTTERDTTKDAADVFDRFLQEKLNPQEQANLIAECKKPDSANIFCYSVLHFDELKEKSKAFQRRKNKVVRRGGTNVRPVFNQKRELLNWKELRSASFGGLIRKFSRLSFDEITEIKRAAIRETDCPNNPAIAIASTLEDFLPEKANLDEIGRLYEKAANCIENNPADKEMVLTRAGLLYFSNRDYNRARDTLQASTQILDAFTGRALYWLHQTQLKLNQKTQARATLELLQARYPFAFHTLIATTGTEKDPADAILKTTHKSLRRSGQVPTVNGLIEQVEALQRYEYQASAKRVLNWAINEAEGAEPELMVYLAELKDQHQDHLGKISLLSEVLYKHPQLVSKETMELYFPKVFFPIFEKQASVVDPYLLLAIARRESAFNVRAVSPAKAKGLLQILPSTGRRLKKHPNLFSPEENVEIGARYVFELLKKVNGQIHLALAAYNAGPQKVTTWINRYSSDEPILFIDLIPYRETREYVASVLRNYYWYRRLHQGQTPVAPTQLLELAISKSG